MAFHQCAYCSQPVSDGDPYCAKCGGPQTFKPKRGGVRLTLDPWCITDPEAKQRFEGDAEAVAALVNTWRNDPDHAHTRQVQEEITQARDQGDLTRTSYYYCCPWSAVYRVNRDTRIDSNRLRRGQQFTFDVSAEGIPKGRPFKRELVVGDFQPTEQIDYCLPGQEEEDE